MSDQAFLDTFYLFSDDIVNIEYLHSKPKERRGQVRTRIQQLAFFKAYCKYLELYHPGSKPRFFHTFLEEVVELGVIVVEKPIRIRPDKSQRTFKVVEIFWFDYQRAFKKLYRGDAPANWVCEQRGGLELLYTRLGKLLYTSKNPV
jgi:hypothetical protein